MASGLVSDPARLQVVAVVTGPGGSGKTSLIRRFVNNYFPKPGLARATANGTAVATKRSVVGLEFARKLVTVQDGEDKVSVVLQIAEDEDVSSPKTTPRRGYKASAACQKAQGALMILDATAADTVDALRDLAQRKLDFDSDVSYRNGDRLPVVLVATKADEASSLDEAALKRFAKDNDFAAFFAVSAKNGTHVAEAFDAITQEIMQHQDRWREDKMTYEDMFVENCACG